MANITLTIQAETADELIRELTLLGRPTLYVKPEEPANEYSPGASTEAETEDKPKRVRRTKAEMEAARAEETREMVAATEARQADDAFAAQIKAAQAEETGTATIEAARAAMKAFLAKPGKDVRQLQSILVQVGGAPKITEVDASKYADVILALGA